MNNTFTQSTKVTSPTVNRAYDPEIKAYLDKIRTDKPHMGPIKIGINTGLVDKNKAAQVVDLTAKLGASQSGFQIQRIPAGPVVFSETFVKSQSTLEETRVFKVTNTDKRYTLHIQRRGTKDSNGKIAVNINGTNWIKEQDFREHNQEIEQESLLLNANNSLRVRLSGRAGTSVTVTVVEGVQAGTLLRRRGNLRKPGETQATHIRRNDTNIFNPNEADSLGGLEPYQGTFQPSGSHFPISKMDINNGEDVTTYEVGTVLLSLSNPAQDLPFLENLYGATVLDNYEIEGFDGQIQHHYYLKFDLSKSPVEEIADLIHQQNGLGFYQIEEVNFSSFAALQTFTILMDLMMNHRQRVGIVDFNYYQELPSGVSPVQVNDYVQEPSPSINGGWIRETKLAEAWNYSVGTGVKTAYIDGGFSASSTKTFLTHPEFPHRRLILDPAFSNFSSAFALAGNAHAYTFMPHALAEFDNGTAPPGSAPNSNFIPYYGAESGDGTINALKKIVTNIDIYPI
jgi:hypothetical protein